MSDTKIIQCIVPELTAGEYNVSVEQNISTGDATKKIDKTFTFGVDAARFTLNPNDIYSVYPPENTTGDYSNHLPHIVFNRRTLPWERTIDGALPKYKKENKEPVACPPVPWMALLLYSEKEMERVKISETKLSDIIINEKATDNILRPQIHKDSGVLQLMPWEQEDQKCYTIDISAEQFNQAIPSENDLPFLAHSKFVNIDHKDQNGIEDAETETTTETFKLKNFSSIETVSDKSNGETTRKEEENVAVKKDKVTGHGYFSVLMGNRIITQKEAYTAVLVSLEGYGDYISSRKTIGSEKVRLVVLAHWKFNNQGTKTFKALLDNIEVKSMYAESASPTLKAYLDQGYMPMKHLMKNGAKNMSWYRGPFVPNQIGFDSFQFHPYTSADGALRYDPKTGLMDVSIAAAWELGKMLALQNKAFTKAIVAWNTNPIDNPDVSGQDETFTSQEIVKWLKTGTVDQKTKRSSFITYKPYPDVVTDFLKDLASLKGVPMSYLIPDKKYVISHQEENIKETLNLFYIDPLWIYALLEGAVSLTGEPITQTRYNISNIIKEVYYFKGHDKAMGFILYSPLVSGWRGIEVKAYEKDSDTIPLDFPIRFERVLPDMFLGVFPATIKKIEVIQPYEGLHFGVKPGTNSHFSKSAKNVHGKSIVPEMTINDDLLKGKDKDIIDIGKMVERLKSITNDTTFTSAEFAYQMIDSPILATFKFNEKIIKS